MDNINIKAWGYGEKCIRYNITKDSEIVGIVFSYVQADGLNIIWSLFDFFINKDIVEFIQGYEGVILNDYREIYIYSTRNEVFLNGKIFENDDII